MNYLAHHTVAKRREPQADPLYYTGNLLPDLLGASDVIRLRALHLPPESDNDSPLFRGMRLHFETDKRFHATAAFTAACTDASERLRARTFVTPLRRVFFLAHILTEIALDGHLIQADATVADDLYATLLAVDTDQLEAEFAAILPADSSPSAVTGLIQRFIEFGYLRSYRTPSGQAEAVYRVCGRGGLKLFHEQEDRQMLETLLQEFAGPMAQYAPDLLAV